MSSELIEESPDTALLLSKIIALFAATVPGVTPPTRLISAAVDTTNDPARYSPLEPLCEIMFKSFADAILTVPVFADKFSDPVLSTETVPVADANSPDCELNKVIESAVLIGFGTRTTELSHAISLGVIKLLVRVVELHRTWREDPPVIF